MAELGGSFSFGPMMAKSCEMLTSAAAAAMESSGQSFSSILIISHVADSFGVSLSSVSTSERAYSKWSETHAAAQ
jgi:hypothetical protein